MRTPIVTEGIKQPTMGLRWVNRDGAPILQQAWEYDEIIDGKAEARMTEWRDVPTDKG